MLLLYSPLNSYLYVHWILDFKSILLLLLLLLCGRSASSVIPGIFGLAWSLARCVSWRHRQGQGGILHNSDSMDALLADTPSAFADITAIAPEGL